jgi:ABC-type branched-subunit amino acid transport system ATPase component
MTDGLTVENLTVAYGGVVAVTDVSLTVPSGTCVGILGANGAGKSTLLRGISGLQKAASGATVRLGEVEMQSMKPSVRARKGIGHVLEGRHVFPNLTVLENLEVAASAQGRSRKMDSPHMARVMTVLPELDELMSRPAGSLSGGQQQFLAVARAMVAEPSIVLLDEPTVGLAPRLVARIEQIIRDLTKSGVGVLLVEQRIDVVTATATQVHLLVHGRIAETVEASDPDLSRKAHEAYLS